MIKRLYSRPEAAAYLAVSVTTLAGLSIPRKVNGGRVFYDRSDLDAWADALPYETERDGKRTGCSTDEVFG